MAGPAHDMSWMTGFTAEPGAVEAIMGSTGAVLAGRDGYDSAIGDSRPFGGAWDGPIFILTHHPDDARPAEGITILSCPVEDAVRIGLDAAAGKNLGIYSPSIGAQLLELGLIDEVEIFVAPVLLGDGIRLYDVPGTRTIRLHRLDGDDPAAAAHLRFRPVG
ncbi:MAG: dihydrofolate reductase family protein [Nocardioidaceae bacterium]